MKKIIGIFIFSMIAAMATFNGSASAANWRDIEFIFARGSGAARNGSGE